MDLQKAQTTRMACVRALELCILNEGFLRGASVEHVVSTAGACAGVWAAYVRSKAVVWTTYAKEVDLAGLDDLLCRLFRTWPEMAEVVYKSALAAKTLPTTSRDMLFPCAASANGKLALVHAMCDHVSTTTMCRALGLSYGNALCEFLHWMDTLARWAGEDEFFPCQLVVVVLLNLRDYTEDEKRTIFCHCAGTFTAVTVIKTIGRFFRFDEFRYHEGSPYKNVALILEVFDINLREFCLDYMWARDIAAGAGDIQTVRVLRDRWGS